MRKLMVFGEKTFQITVPDGARITFGPWSPPGMKDARTNYGDRALAGTLRIYQGPSKTSEDIIAVFSNVSGFRDVTLEYMEEVVREAGQTIWRSDEHGYMRESRADRKTTWVEVTPQLTEGPNKAEPGEDTPDTDDIPF